MKKQYNELETIYFSALKKFIPFYDRNEKEIFCTTATASKLLKKVIKIHPELTPIFDSYKDVNGFYIKKDGLSFTLYLSPNGFNSGYSVQLSIIVLGEHTIVQYGGGYGASGFDMIWHKQLMDLNEISGFNSKKLTKKAILKVIEIFTNK